jgi:hypothetical protein
MGWCQRDLKEDAMPVSWKPSTVEAHEQLPRKRTGPTQDPAWEEVMRELAAGNPVILEYADPKERGSLARSVGRRAAHCGMRVELRDGDGYISVRSAGEAPGGSGRRGRGGA